MSVKRFAPLMIALIGSMMLATTSYAAPTCSDWAVPAVEEAYEAGITTVAYYTEDLSQPLSRYNMACLLTSTYMNQVNCPYTPNADSPDFIDAPTWSVTYGLSTWNVYPYQWDMICFPVDSGIMRGVSDIQFNPEGTLTRQEFAKVMVGMAYYDRPQELSLDAAPQTNFTDFAQVADWGKAYVAKAQELGIMDGYPDGRFGPLDPVTWEQALSALVRYFPLKVSEPLEITSHKNNDIVSSQETLKVKINSNDDDCWIHLIDSSGRLLSNHTGSYSSYLLVPGERFTLVADYYGKVSKPVTIYSDRMQSQAYITADEEHNQMTLSIQRMNPGTYFDLKIVERRWDADEAQIPAREKLSVGLLDAESYTFQADCNRIYDIYLTSWNETIHLQEFTWGVKHDPELVDALYAMGGFANQAQAKAAMVSIQVPVWRLNNGVKTAGTGWLTVHPLLADAYKAVFTDIFNGPEQFPIKEMGAFSWRGDNSNSAHNEGIAVDINANENYCIYSNGTTIGAYWRPYEDPYSINPYGDVVRAFENNGFIWGGDAWGNPLDYMHFNYLNSL